MDGKLESLISIARPLFAVNSTEQQRRFRLHVKANKNNAVVVLVSMEKGIFLMRWKYNPADREDPTIRVDSVSMPVFRDKFEKLADDERVLAYGPFGEGEFAIHVVKAAGLMKLVAPDL